jgi:hypothetical protein
VRYTAVGEPERVTICHCTFCQRLTGSAFLVEPIFKQENAMFLGAAPNVYEHRSNGSGRLVSVHFCGWCGTHLMLSFERFGDVVGMCGGTFDDPNWFDRGPGRERHIFTRSAQKGVLLPADIEIYNGHAIALDGTPNHARVLTEPSAVR